MLRIIFLVAWCLCTNTSRAAAPAHTADWITRSNQLAREYTLERAVWNPESASSEGYREFDAQAMRVVDDMVTPERERLRRWQKRLRTQLRGERDAEYRVDVQLLLHDVEEELVDLRLDERFGVIPFHAGTEIIFNNLRELINEQTDATRRRAAALRFHKYVRGFDTFAPLLSALQSQTRAVLQQHPHRQLLPTRQEVQHYLDDSASYVASIRTLLQQCPRTDWHDDYRVFVQQSQVYDAFVRSDILPHARDDFHLPAALYQFNVRSSGIHTPPTQLIRAARADYRALYQQFTQLAARVAQAHGWTDTTPAAVIRNLKIHTTPHGGAPLALYRNANQLLTRVIRDHDLLTLPATPLHIRLGGDSESRSQPIPHLLSAPLVNNHGERPEFVIPATAHGTLSLDDFSYPAAAVILTAHEGRPGHDIQFSTMLDRGTSIIRAEYAFNSANVEGWALYAESIVTPFLPDDMQLVGLQFRLWRTARAFLDPEVQLGRITPDEVMHFLTEELGASKKLADLEVRRYTYDMPGQAPSYYYGFTRLLAAKHAMQHRLGKNFSERCFNDTVLSFGLLPIDILCDRLRNSMSCSQ